MDRPWYSFVNEDSRAEREILFGSTYENVVCITGSGERVIALMDAPHVRRFHAIDIDPSANYLLEFKLAALRVLGVNKYLQFCGMHGEPVEMTIEDMSAVLRDLDSPTRMFWESRIRWIRSGVAHCGHFERWFARIRPIVKIFLGKGFYSYFETDARPKRSFPRRRWRILLGLFSKRWTYRLFGNRDTAFVAKDSNPKLIADALRTTLPGDGTAKSFFFHFLFRGDLESMSAEELPPSVQPVVLTRVLEQSAKPDWSIEFHNGDLIDVLDSWNRQDFSSTLFLLSDILSFNNFDYLLRFLKRLTGENISVVFRSFLRHSITEKQLEVLRSDFRSAVDISDYDLSHMYRVYHIVV